MESAKRRVAILANPRAGTGDSRRLVEQLQGALHGRGFQPILCWEREDLDRLRSNGDIDDLRCVVSAGGDGTLLEVVNRLPGMPVALFPLGNENLVAKFCGLGPSPHKLAEIIETGQLRQVDLARCNERLFSLMTSAGVDAEVVHRVHQRRRGHINKFSYVMPTIQAFSSYAYPAIDVELPETGERLRGAMVFVFNLPRYALNLPLPLYAKPDDGLIDVYVFERPGLWNLGRYLKAILGRKQSRLPDHHHRQGRQVVLSAAGAVPMQTDGDPAGRLPARLEVVPGALTLVVGPS